MRYLLFVLFLVQATVTKSQPCENYASMTHDKAGESMYAFNKHIDVNGENAYRLFSIYGFVWTRSVVLVVEVVDEFQCLGLDSKAIFEFSDGSVAERQNALSNCDRRLVAHLNERDSLHELLRSKQLTSLQVVTKAGVRAETAIDHKSAEDLRLSVACLSSFIEGTRTSARKDHQKLPEEASADSSLVFTVVEQQPEFFGGYAALFEFLKENFKIKSSRKTTGKVLISFIVDKDGRVRNAEVLKGVSPEIDAEALRVVNMMPRWRPGLQKGQPVSVRFVLPIKF